MSTTVKEILRNKTSKTVYRTAPGDTVISAISLMSEQNIGALPVVEGEKIVGIVSERDYMRKVILKGRTSQTAQVAEIMTGEVLCVTPEDKAEPCMALMVLKRIRHLPVLENGMLIGMISMGDLAKVIISDHETLIDELVGYIQGERTEQSHPERAAAPERRASDEQET